VQVARAFFFSDRTLASLVALRTTWRGIPSKASHVGGEQW